MSDKHVRNWFSNMLPLDEPFVYGGMRFHTVEAFYQACKVVKSDTETRRRISKLDPYRAKQTGKQVRLRSDWEAVKLSVMAFGLRKKFAQGTSWHRQLMATNDAYLEETNSWHDNFYGNCTCGVRAGCKAEGVNNLGKLLMKIRVEFAAGYQAECARVGHAYRLTDLSGTMLECKRCFEYTPKRVGDERQSSSIRHG